MLIHSPQRSRKSQLKHVGTTALLFLLFLPLVEQEFLFPSVTFHTAHAFDIICRLDRNDTLDDVPQNKKTESCHWAASRQTP